MTPPTDQRIGLLAGAGDIPLYFARKAAETGMRLVSVGFTEEIGTRLEPYVEKNYCIGVGRTSKIFSTLKSENVQDLLILGKVDKSVIFRPQLFDLRSLKFLNQMRNNEDKTLMVGVIRELEKEGFRLLDQRRLMPELFPPKGVLTRRRPSKEAWQDIEFGLPLAKKVADLEIG
ncbi:MAG: DUF1009 domain-containing protein, partial [Nitrospinaceae bacterium]|nr:LpxI family protein [Nitrospinaceae bacterium]NIR56898.1 LpxI family protein [Nitrospinaceae bacterium]NIS87359.1 LpxI family protein [Nitrospinaceae bacterium]NIT84215.1 LpxI family protein [Nitrospinaceae bacterium]NIU46399.1 LpxI family protein [Nitrospinaceae bacterium]